MAKIKSAVSRAKRTKLKSAASKKVSRVRSASANNVAKAKSAASKKVSRVKSAAAGSPGSVKSAASSKVSRVKSAAQPFDTRSVSAEADVNLSTRSAAEVPLGEAVEATDAAVRNIPEGANIYDSTIGYGLALPGETGADAVQRIQTQRSPKKAVVKKTKKK